MRRRVALAAFLVALVLLWQPVLRPAYKGAVILLDVYTTTLFQRNLAALVTPPPRYEEELLTLAGTTMRVSWWRPAWGGRHPAILLVNGASTAGNDMPEIRMISDAVARAGYLVMLPEFPFLKEERLEAAAVDQIDAAFAVLARTTRAGRRSGRSVSPSAAARSSRPADAAGRCATPATSASSAPTTTSTRTSRAS